eukprot:8540370-Heterocapsa_arctica.AAC.1
MGKSATISGSAQNSAEATRQFALSFVRSSGSETGAAYGPTTSMHKRDSSVNLYVGIIAMST